MLAASAVQSSRSAYVRSQTSTANTVRGNQHATLRQGVLANLFILAIHCTCTFLFKSSSHRITRKLSCIEHFEISRASALEVELECASYMLISTYNRRRSRSDRRQLASIWIRSTSPRMM